MQCLDIVSFLVESLRKADEWGEKMFVISMDVASAFDSVSAQVLGDVLLERGATTISAAAAVRENLELRARPCLPSGWNQVMAVLIEELLQLWAGRAPAVSWAPEWMPFEILVWADNIFLVSSSTTDILKRTQEIAYVFGKRGLRFNKSSLEIFPSKMAEREATRIPLNEGTEFSWVRILVVLGCYLDGSGSTETQVKGRLGQGRKMFGKLRPMLCCPRIPEEERDKTILHHGGFKCLVEIGLLDSVDKNPSSSNQFRKTGGSAACWEAVKTPRCSVGGLVPYDKTLCASVKKAS